MEGNLESHFIQNSEERTRNLTEPRMESKKDLSANIQKIPLAVKRWPHFRGQLPQYETAQASGFDIRAQLDHEWTVKPGQRVLIPTGLSFSIPLGYELQVRPRSGWALKKGMTLLNSPGTIDADYRGEVKIIAINLGQDDVIICDQDRVAQMILCPVFQIDFITHDELDMTARGEKGFGSTGVE